MSISSSANPLLFCHARGVGAEISRARAPPGIRAPRRLWTTAPYNAGGALVSSAWDNATRASSYQTKTFASRRHTYTTPEQKKTIIMDSDDEIPVIDIAPLIEKIDDPNMANDKDILQVVQMLDIACKNTGLFYVKGHGISELLMREVRDVAKQLFHLPYEEKIKIKMTHKSGYRGYQMLGTHVTTNNCDMHEALNHFVPIIPGKYGDLGKPLEGPNLWPDEYPIDSKLLVENYSSLLKDLSRKIMRGIALALGGPVDAFEGTVAGDPFWAFRLISYPTSTDVPKDKRTDTGMGPHTDYGLLTVVNQDENISALEIQNHAGKWICARPIPGTFVCNIGDMLEVYSNGIYKSPVHRIVNNSLRSRVSAAFFYLTNLDAPIEPAEFCRERTGGTAKYEKVSCAEQLLQKSKRLQLN